MGSVEASCVDTWKKTFIRKELSCALVSSPILFAQCTGYSLGRRRGGGIAKSGSRPPLT
jgi:hypothetical protein